MNLCQYKDIFGKPKEGVHSYRLFDVAIVDVVLTIFGAWLISKRVKYNFVKVLGILMIISIIVHKMFCVETTLTKFIN